MRHNPLSCRLNDVTRKPTGANYHVHVQVQRTFEWIEQKYNNIYNSWRLIEPEMYPIMRKEQSEWHLIQVYFDFD